MGELLAAAPGRPLIARTDAPGWLFPEAVRWSPKAVDVGLAQSDALTVDLAETARRHAELAARWEREVEAEAAFLKEEKAGLVVCDASPLGCAAAERAGVPAVVVANFLWDWVLEDLARAEPSLAGPAALYRRAYASARELLRLPLSGGFEGRARVVDAPLLFRRSPASRAQARAKLGLDGRPAVLLTFGGVGLAAPAAGAGLERFQFVGWGRAPTGLERNWTALPDGRAGAHVEAMAACDAALTKPGYGVISESIAHQTRLLYLPREGFIEIPVLLAGLERHGCGAALPPEDFRAGRWAPALEALLARPWKGRPLPLDGAAFAVSRLTAVT